MAAAPYGPGWLWRPWTEFYAVMGRYAQNNGKRFLADDYLSGINSYRRTEQALSFALKSGDTGSCCLARRTACTATTCGPEPAGSRHEPGRLALAGLRNAKSCSQRCGA